MASDAKANNKGSTELIDDEPEGELGRLLNTLVSQLRSSTWIAEQQAQALAEGRPSIFDVGAAAAAAGDGPSPVAAVKLSDAAPSSESPAAALVSSTTLADVAIPLPSDKLNP